MSLSLWHSIIFITVILAIMGVLVFMLVVAHITVKRLDREDEKRAEKREAPAN